MESLSTVSKPGFSGVGLADAADVLSHYGTRLLMILAVYVPRKCVSADTNHA